MSQCLNDVVARQMPKIRRSTNEYTCMLKRIKERQSNAASYVHSSYRAPVDAEVSSTLAPGDEV